MSNQFDVNAPYYQFANVLALAHSKSVKEDKKFVPCSQSQH